MDLPPKLDEKLSVRYISDKVEKERRKLKRKEKFCLQVKRGVTKMQVVINRRHSRLNRNLKRNQSFKTLIARV